MSFTSKPISNSYSESTATVHKRMVLSPLTDDEEICRSADLSLDKNFQLSRAEEARDNFCSTSSKQSLNNMDSPLDMEDVTESVNVNQQSLINDGLESDLVDSDNEEMIMSVYWRNGKLGAAYYNTVSSELHALNEIADSKSEHTMLRNLYKMVQPVLVIADSRAKSLVSCLNSLAAPSTKLNFLPKEEFNFESCKRRIYLLRLPNEPEQSSQEERHIFLQSVVNFQYAQTVHALGALLKYLDKNWCRLNIDSNSTPSFLAIHSISLSQIVTMDDESYRALQVFNRMSHPSNFKKGTAHSGKEGLSLFGIFNCCCSKIGSQRLKLLLQQPTNDKATIEGRFDTIAFLNKPGNEEIVKYMCTLLRHIKNVNGLLTRIKGLRASPYEWKSLFNTLYNGVLICKFCEKYVGNSPLIDALGSSDNHNLFQVTLHMNRVVDFDLSKAQGKFTVKLGVDPELDHKKQKMMGLHSLMSATAKCELEKLPPFIEECTMVYLPNLGYLLGVKTWAPNLTREDKQIENLKFMFQNNNYIHYKSKGCEELDQLIGDTHPEILAHEMRIMMRLTKFILQHLHTLASVIDLCAELDCLVAIAKTCKDNDYRRPTITTERLIDIKNGRHPLQELCIDNFVPNSTKSSLDSNLITILTGANSSGKSIYLKQVALIVYMAHIGSFVPAETATIGLIHHIYTRVQTVEDISNRMSAFLIDLRQMSLAITESTTSSLIIVDEFGKGTSEVDGLALLAACINHFLYRQDNVPHVLISTHFQSIAQYLITSFVSSPYLNFQTLEHCVQDTELVFLYKLKNGMADCSLALQVAETVGIDDYLVKRAKHIFETYQTCIPAPDENSKIYKIQKQIINNIKNITKEKISKKYIEKMFAE